MAAKARIEAFWSWFTDWHQDVETAYSAGDAAWLDRNFTPQVKRLHPRINWEMGPYHHPKNTLVISPGVRENLSLTRRIVAAAPELTGWHFLPAKPAKHLKQLTMELPGKPGAEVDADHWSYRLTAYNGMEFFDMEVFTDVDATISANDLEILTRLLIESLVGEELYLERIAAVQIVRRADNNPKEKLTRFPLLGRHLASLLHGG